MSANYYMFVDQQYGPFDLAALQTHLREGRLTKDSWIFLEGETADWTRAEEVPSLKFLFQAPAASAGTVPLKASSLAERLKQSTQPQPAAESGDDFGGTLLVSPTAKNGVRAIKSVLPSAPLSDIPQQPATTAAAKSMPTTVAAATPAAPVQPAATSPQPAKPQPTKNWWNKLKGIFRRSK
ncbi:MAG: DUF4339 domain-containing protein [Verrucomicrobia bacterium]|nr:DUF4339 domain-containing protein [Verrucomicrobiota bacterium]